MGLASFVASHLLEVNWHKTEDLRRPYRSADRSPCRRQEAKGTGLVVYADDVPTSSTHEKMVNKLIFADKKRKTQASLFTPDPAEYSRQLNLTIRGQRLKITRHPKILGLTFDTKLNFTEHVKFTKDKA